MLKAKKTASKAGALLLAAALTFQLLPGTAFAAEGGNSSGSEPFSLNYAEIDDTSGKLWIGEIGETVFDGIRYSKKSTGDRADAVTLDEETGTLTVGEGYTLSETGRPAQAVTFEVDAKYYDSSDVLWSENFEGAQLGDKGVAKGGGQKFSGLYGKQATPTELREKADFELPVVIDPVKARAGQKSVTQGTVEGQNAEKAQSEGVKGVFEDTLSQDAWATMWYYDDGVKFTSGQFGFMGGVVTKSWQTGAFGGAIGAANNTTSSVECSVYRTRAAGNAWSNTEVARTKGWHKFQWKIGAENTEMYIDGTKLGVVSNVKQSDFGGFNIVFNWNNQGTPVNNKHFIDSFYVVNAGADGNPKAAGKTFQAEKTVYVISDEDVLNVSYTQEADSSKGTIALGNVAGIGATIDACTFTPDVDLTNIATIEAGTGDKLGAATVTPKTGYVLSDANNQLAKKVTVAVKADYHFGDNTADADTFTGEVAFYYDVDETNTPVDDLTGTGPRETVDLSGEWQFGGKNAKSVDAVTDWQTVTVPHDWNAKTGDGVKSRENGTFWYRKTLELTAEKAAEYNQRSAYLEFDSVGMEAHVFLNGTEVGSHKGGWSAFKIDVTGKLKEGANVIEVSANNERTLNGDIAPLHGDFDNASGINRDVRLVMTSQVHLDQLDHGSHGVYIIPEKTGDTDWTVKVTARVANDTVSGRDVTVKATVSHPTSFDDVLKLGEKGLLQFDPAELYEANGTQVGTGTVTIKANRQSATDAKLNLSVSNPKLWKI